MLTPKCIYEFCSLTLKTGLDVRAIFWLVIAVSKKMLQHDTCTSFRVHKHFYYRSPYITVESGRILIASLSGLISVFENKMCSWGQCNAGISSTASKSVDPELIVWSTVVSKVKNET